MLPLLLAAAAAPWRPNDYVDSKALLELERADKAVETSVLADKAAANRGSGIVAPGAIPMPISSFFDTDGKNREPSMLVRHQTATCPECAPRHYCCTSANS